MADVEEAYLAENNQLNAPTYGLRYRLSKRLDDISAQGTPDSIVIWGTVVYGIVEDGWLRVRNGYLPMKVSGADVLIKTSAISDSYYVDNNGLNADSHGLAYRRSKALSDVSEEAPGSIAFWGTTVRGVDEGDHWLRVGDRYLPTMLGSVPVLVKKTDGLGVRKVQAIGLHHPLEVPRGVPHKGQTPQCCVAIIVSRVCCSSSRKRSVVGTQHTDGTKVERAMLMADKTAEEAGAPKKRVAESVEAAALKTPAQREKSVEAAVDRAVDLEMAAIEASAVNKTAEQTVQSAKAEESAAAIDETVVVVERQSDKQLAAKEIITQEVVADNVVVEKTGEAKAPVDQAVAEKPVVEQATQSTASALQAVTKQEIAEKVAVEKLVADKVVAEPPLVKKHAAETAHAREAAKETAAVDTQAATMVAAGKAVPKSSAVDKVPSKPAITGNFAGEMMVGNTAPAVKKAASKPPVGNFAEKGMVANTTLPVSERPQKTGADHKAPAFREEQVPLMTIPPSSGSDFFPHKEEFLGSERDHGAPAPLVLEPVDRLPRQSETIDQTQQELRGLSCCKDELFGPEQPELPEWKNSRSSDVNIDGPESGVICGCQGLGFPRMW